MHNTRHTFTSIMLNNQIEPLWACATLGHKNLDVTLKIYILTEKEAHRWVI